MFVSCTFVMFLFCFCVNLFAFVIMCIVLLYKINIVYSAFVQNPCWFSMHFCSMVSFHITMTYVVCCAYK